MSDQNNTDETIEYTENALIIITLLVSDATMKYQICQFYGLKKTKFSVHDSFTNAITIIICCSQSMFSPQITEHKQRPRRTKVMVIGILRTC